MRTNRDSFRRWASCGLLGSIALAGSAQAVIIPAFFLEFPTAYVMGAVVQDPPSDTYVFDIGPPPFFYSPGYVATVGIGTVSATSTSTHIFAPHAGETAPGPTWTKDLSVAFPLPYGMAEDRKRGKVGHPGSTDVDKYMAVLGAFSGTVPGPSLASSKGFIGGSIGKHTDPNTPNVLLMKSTPLSPPSGHPNTTTQDFPVGQALIMGDQMSMQLTALVIVADILDGDVQGINLLSGPTGPILYSLRPMMMQQPTGAPFSAAFTMLNQPIPASVMQKIATGSVWVSVQTQTSPDGQITGLLSTVPCEGDLNGDGVVSLADVAIQLSHYGHPGATAADGDLNGDGIVNLADIAKMLSLYGSSCD